MTSLHEQYGWDGLAQKINVNCFKNDPSVKSSLKFLRKTPWARSQVEDLYVSSRKTPSPSPWDKASEQFQASNTTENSEDEL